MRINALVSALSATLLLSAAAAFAQPTSVDPKGCAPGERLQQNGSGSADPKVPSTTGENLSDKLARTDGVLCPPNVDPDIKAPTPQGGNMPIIPPPGSPGGNQNVQPK
jgi:hypothetical protein